MSWTVPVYYQQVVSYSSIWPGVGLGQSKSAQLLQAGTEQDYLGLTQGQENYAWWQVYPQDHAQNIAANMYIQAFDQMYVHVGYSGGKFVAHIDDESSTDSVWISENLSGPPDLGHADWVLERTEENCQFPQLFDFNAVELGGDYATGSNGQWVALGSWPSHWYTWMQDDSGTGLAHPDAIYDGDNFNVIWTAFGETDPGNC